MWPTESSPQAPTRSVSLPKTFVDTAPESAVNNLCLSHVESTIPKGYLRAGHALLQRSPPVLTQNTATLTAEQGGASGNDRKNPSNQLQEQKDM